MLDWNMYELEDISWEEFGRSDDHIVPHRRGEHAHESMGHGDLHKKQHQETEAAVARADDELITFEKADRISIDRSLADWRTLLVGSSQSHDCTDAFPLPSDPQRISVVSALASHGSRISDGTFTKHQIDTNDNISCRNVSIGNVVVGISNASKMCQPSSADVSPEEKEPQLLQQMKNNVILDYELDDIDNFENVDKMFRNCQNAFAHGSIGSADELSWFSPSSQTIDGCEDTFNFGIQSSYPEFVSLTKSLKFNGSNLSFLVENDYITEAHLHSSLDYCANTNWLDTDVEVSESMTAKETKVSAVAQNSNSRTSEFKGPDMDSAQMKLPRGPTNTTERRKSGLSETKNGFHVHYSDTMQSLHRKNDFSSASSSLKTCPSPVMSHGNLGPTDSSDHTCSFDYHVKMENGHVIQRSTVKESVACVESEVRSNISPPCEVSVDVTNHGQQATECCVHTLSTPPTMVEEDTNKISYKRQSHVPDIGKTCENFMCQVPSSNQDMLQNKSFTSQHGAHGEVGLAETGIQCPKFDIDYLAVKENNMIITVFSDDISLGSADFRKLQDVLDQLDIRTKLCIRDGLYRLARNAEMRHCVDSIKHNRAGSGNSSRSPRMKKPKQSSEFIWETGTNLIDRYIAHLLFYRASDSSSSPINYAMSHESHITNEQKYGSSSMPSDP